MKFEWILNALLAMAWGYIAMYVFPSAMFLFIQTGRF